MSSPEFPRDPEPIDFSEPVTGAPFGAGRTGEPRSGYRDVYGDPFDDPDEPIPRGRYPFDDLDEPPVTHFVGRVKVDDVGGRRPRHTPYTPRYTRRNVADFDDGNPHPEFTEEELMPRPRPGGRGRGGRTGAPAGRPLTDQEIINRARGGDAAATGRRGSSTPGEILARVRNRLDRDPEHFTRGGSLTRPVGSITERTTHKDYEGYEPPSSVVERLEDVAELNAGLKREGIGFFRRLRAARQEFNNPASQGSELGRQGIRVRAGAAVTDYLNGVFTRREENGQLVTRREMLRRRVVFGLGAAAVFAVTWASVKSGIDVAGAINLGTPLDQFPTPDIPAAGQDVFRGAGNVIGFFGGEKVGGKLVENAEYYEQVARGVGAFALLANASYRIGQAVRGGIRIDTEGAAADRATRQALNRDRRILRMQDREERREEGRRWGERFANAERQFWSPAAVEERIRIAAEGRQRVGRFLGRLFTAARVREYFADRRAR